MIRRSLRLLLRPDSSVARQRSCAARQYFIDVDAHRLPTPRVWGSRDCQAGRRLHVSAFSTSAQLVTDWTKSGSRGNLVITKTRLHAWRGPGGGAGLLIAGPQPSTLNLSPFLPPLSLARSRRSPQESRRRSPQQNLVKLIEPVLFNQL